MPDTLKFGQVTTGDAAAHQLKEYLVPSGDSVVLKARSDNAGKVYLGHDNTVSANNGYELVAGESFVVDALNIGKVWVKQANGGDHICWGVLSG